MASEFVGTTPVSFPKSITNQSNSSENTRVAVLKREVQEKENKINELTLEINMLKLLANYII